MIKLYADGADMNGIIESAKDPNIVGFTTNPTLMRQAGVTDYTAFAKGAINYLAAQRPGTNISLEVFADKPEEILRQARLIDYWGEEAGYDVYVKIPVMYTSGQNTYDLIHTLIYEGIKVTLLQYLLWNRYRKLLMHCIARHRVLCLSLLVVLLMLACQLEKSFQVVYCIMMLLEKQETR